MRKGIRVLIPVYSIHHDPKYYPDPERFDPERFSEENIKTRPEGTYLPFGDGPRICIGMYIQSLVAQPEFGTEVKCKLNSRCLVAYGLKK